MTLSEREASSAPSHVVLWGQDHPALGEVEVAALNGSTAVGISAGRRPKPYAHLDPNEDATLAAAGSTRTLLSVADGHSGFDAARGAIKGVLETLDMLDAPLDGAHEELLQGILLAARDQVRTELADVIDERRSSRTALSVALLARGVLLVGGWGDTQVLRVRGRRAKPVGSVGPFLDPSTGQLPRLAQARLRADDVVLACSDGLVDYLPGDWAKQAANIIGSSRDAEAAARTLIEAACANGAGDHVSVALSQW